MAKNNKEQAIITAACDIINAMDAIHSGESTQVGVDLVKLRKAVEAYQGKNK